jgi:uncharacterized damage-inducible protein DinB
MTTTLTKKFASTHARDLAAEFEHELNTTRKFLQRIPRDKLAWTPHEKSMTVGQLAWHIAEVPSATLKFSLADESEAPDFSAGRHQPKTLDEAMEIFESGAKEVIEILPTVGDDRMRAKFQVLQNGNPVMSMPRSDFLRYIMLNHWYHHRGQLGVYLRMLGVPVPSSYGPSADESPFAGS